MNSQQFKEQILPMYKQMLAVAARMFDGDMDTAADAVQDTIAKLWERRKEIEISQSPNALCIAAVRNRCISIIRSRHIDLAVNTEMPDIPDGASADANSDAERVRMAINIGFNDVLSFSKFFSKNIGISPLNYRIKNENNRKN